MSVEKKLDSILLGILEVIHVIRKVAFLARFYCNKISSSLTSLGELF
jgi:hypothetical protein